MIFKRNKKRDKLRDEIQYEFDNGALSKTEYDMLWDLTTDKRFNLCKYYLDQAVQDSKRD